MLPKGFASIIEHLHRNSPTGFTPGTAITGGDKNQMVFWVPGRNRHSRQSVLRAYSNAKLFGLAPVAYKDIFAPKNEQDVYINYLALDIDSKDLNISKEEAVEILLTKNRAYQVRLSTSGNGLHAFLVLEEPIFAKKEEVKSIYTQLTQPLVDELPFKVDKADLRILYVYGKNQAWVVKNDKTYKVEKPVARTVATPLSQSTVKCESIPELEEAFEKFAGYKWNTGQETYMRLGDIRDFVKTQDRLGMLIMPGFQADIEKARSVEEYRQVESSPGYNGVMIPNPPNAWTFLSFALGNKVIFYLYYSSKK
jgi:hypothetical protein